MASKEENSDTTRHLFLLLVSEADRADNGRSKYMATAEKGHSLDIPRLAVHAVQA